MLPRNKIGSWMTEEMAASGDGPVQTPQRSSMENKFMAIIAVTQRGYHYFEVLERGESINSERYVDFLRNLLQFLSTKLNPIQPENMRLMHDNATPHTALNTQDFAAAQNIRLLKQPPYSPDTNLCDNYIFGRLEAKRKDFESAADVRQFLHEELPHFTAARMAKALENSIKTMTKIIESGGIYV